MAESYLEVFEEASTEMREFFGLRDFYRYYYRALLFCTDCKHANHLM
jgi:hypothetical protein